MRRRPVGRSTGEQQEGLLLPHPLPQRTAPGTPAWRIMKTALPMMCWCSLARPVMHPAGCSAYSSSTGVPDSSRTAAQTMLLQAGSRQGSFPPGQLPKLARPPSFGSVPVTPSEKSPHGSESARSAPRLSKLESMASTAVRAAAKIQVRSELGSDQPRRRAMRERGLCILHSCPVPR